MLLRLQTGRDNEILRTKAKPVKEITKKTLKLIKEMQAAMKVEKGVGLAAPQIGVSERIILVTLDEKKIIPMINPEILEMSEETCIDEEGCLSLPEEFGNVTRAKYITVKYQTPKNEEMILKLSDFNARVVQHEVDHLNGILFTDYLEEDQMILGQMQTNKECL